jgi:hypothetical protein
MLTCICSVLGLIFLDSENDKPLWSLLGLYLIQGAIVDVQGARTRPP